VKFQVGGDGPSRYQAGEKYPFGALEDEQRMLPGEQLRDDGIGLCRMPDDDQLLTSASRVVHEIEQAGSVRGPLVAGSPDHQHCPSVLPDESPNVLHRRHRVLDPVEQVTPSCSLRGYEICKLHNRRGT
jgi:hypothetical protein